MGLLEDAKNKEYREYVDEHIENVFKAYTLLRNMETVLIANFNEINPKVLDNLRGRVLVHDKSKYSESEFSAYRKYFYPANSSEGKNSESVKRLFDDAWKHHYTCNDHHPEYWVDDNGNARSMSIEAILEMICDWVAMGIKFNNSALDWYEDNKSNIKLNEDTREKVEKLLGIIYQFID